MSRFMRVTVSPKGEAKVEVHGGHGTSCALAAGRMGAALGLVTDSENKPEYYEQGPQRTESVTE